MKTRNKLLLLLMCFLSYGAFGLEQKEDGLSNIYAPFGFSNRQPPTDSTITIIDARVSIKAQQVCGYTDWTTAQIHLPKQLLSKQYWKSVGQQAINQAKQAVINLSGALPSMLACNVSPTFCHIMNQAEILAGFETDLTFKQCEMLEGLSNSSLLQAAPLKECIKRTLDADGTMSPGQAREACLVSDNNSDRISSKDEKNNQTASKVGNDSLFNMGAFLSKIFPERVTSSSGRIQSLTDGQHAYSTRSASYALAQKLFPGIGLNARATFQNGGTFQPTIDQDLAQDSKEAEDAIIVILRKMVELHDKGYSPKDIIAGTQEIWEDKEKWRREGKPHPLYRASSDGTEPIMLITPAQILMLIPLVDRSRSDLMSDGLRQAIQRISKASSFVKVNDRLSEIFTNTLDTCKRDQELQDVIHQKNCDLILEQTQANIKILKQKQDMEENARKVQVEIANYVREMQRDELARIGRNNQRLLLENNQEIGVPFRSN